MRRIIMWVLVFQVIVGFSFGEECTSPIRVSMSVLNKAPIDGEPIVIQVVSENTSERPQKMSWAYVHLNHQEDPCFDRKAPLFDFIPGPVIGGSGEPVVVLEPPGTKRTL